MPGGNWCLNCCVCVCGVGYARVIRASALRCCAHLNALSCWVRADMATPRVRVRAARDSTRSA